MRLPIAALATLTTVTTLAIAAPAAQAARSCQREGGRLLAASGSARVVSVAERPRNSETRRDRIYGCWTSTGRRFTLFVARDFGDDLIERDDIEIVDGRYIGVIRHFEGGVSESRTAATWDARRHRSVHDSEPCDQVSTGDFSGVEDAVFFRGGGLAYACGRLRIADARGDRELEPAGTDVRHLAVAANTHGFGERLYWTAGTTPRFLDLG
jgi:hypothetical protein